MINNRSTTLPSVPDPSEPPTLNRADELIKYISDLELESDRLRTILFGQLPVAMEMAKTEGLCSLDGKIASACTRTASMCGFIRTINNRLAG